MWSQPGDTCVKLSALLLLLVKAFVIHSVSSGQLTQHRSSAQQLSSLVDKSGKIKAAFAIIGGVRAAKKKKIQKEKHKKYKLAQRMEAAHTRRMTQPVNR